jgi:hypothetical protein
MAAAGIVLLACRADANDTELSSGGTPRPLTGNTTVSMRSEQVRVEIGDTHVTVDCRFVFHNQGPAEG